MVNVASIRAKVIEPRAGGALALTNLNFPSVSGGVDGGKATRAASVGDSPPVIDYHIFDLASVTL